MSRNRRNLALLVFRYFSYRSALIALLINDKLESYTAFTLSGFDDQERSLTFVKTAFQVLKLKFLGCSTKRAFYPLHKQNIARV